MCIIPCDTDIMKRKEECPSGLSNLGHGGVTAVGPSGGSGLEGCRNQELCSLQTESEVTATDSAQRCCLSTKQRGTRVREALGLADGWSRPTLLAQG